MEGLILRAPSPPDITLCNAFYTAPATLIDLGDCISAEYQMPSGDEPLQYNFMSSGSGDLDLAFPLLYQYGMHQNNQTAPATQIPNSLSQIGTCAIRIDAVDPESHGQDVTAQYHIAPDVFRGMAGWVIQQCVQNTHNGGFTTWNISKVIDNLASIPYVDEWDPEGPGSWRK